VVGGVGGGCGGGRGDALEEDRCIYLFAELFFVSLLRRCNAHLYPSCLSLQFLRHPK
jgi:hypothetical protein